MRDIGIIKYRKVVTLVLICLMLLLGCTTSRANIQASDSLAAKNGESQIVDDDLAAKNDEVKYTLETRPDYSGNAYVEIAGNVPDFTIAEKKSLEPFESYAELDAYGRCGQAFANICKALMPTEERGSIGQIRPSGWQTIKYNDLIEDNYLYNRCHLIAYQLAGENANERNLITGTRYLNIEGMLPFENMVKDYVDLTGNHVLYRATPVFEGENLVASGVELEAWSVEDAGEGICFNVFCYNVQPGIEIDYATGNSKVAESKDLETTEIDAIEDKKKEQNKDTDIEFPEADEVREYVLNLNTRRIHLPECSGVKDMAEHNKQKYTGTISALIEDGYTPCGRCLAEYR